MKWQVAVDSRTIEIHSEQLSAVTEVEPGVYSVLLDGASYEIRLVETPQGLSAEVGARRFAVFFPPRLGKSPAPAAQAGP